VKRPDNSYKFLVHKDGDVSNNHYRNLIWLQTLSGIHNDGIRYHTILGMPEYVLSDTNIPYSFKHGTLKKMKIWYDDNGYATITFYIRKTPYKFLLHRIVNAVRNPNFDYTLVTDHIDRNRSNFDHSNLRSVTYSENTKNIDLTIIKRKEILQYSDTGTLIKKYKSAREAEELSKKEFVIAGVRKNALYNGNITFLENKKTYKGFIWEYTEKREIYVPKEGEVFKLLYGYFQGVFLGYDIYALSNYGTLINIITGLKKKINFSNSYPLHSLKQNGKGELIDVHTLVALLFVEGRTDERCIINHKDENKQNFHYSNLEWVTSQENKRIFGV
jgi:hypothetical protein